MAYNIDVTETLKIVVPALGAWLAAHLANRRERQQWRQKQEEDQTKAFTSQQDKLSAGWSEMTTQMREIVVRLEAETIEAKTRSAVAEEQAEQLKRELVQVRDRLEEELAQIRAKYDAALREIDELKRRIPKRKAAPEA